MAKEKMASGFSLKDHLFNRERVGFLAGLFGAADDGFPKAKFVRQAVKPFPDLELKERIVHLAATLEKHLSPEFPEAAKQIKAALPPPLDPKKTDNDFGDFIFAPLGEFVVRNGLEKRHVKRSLGLLKELTQRFSMEDSIRAFINEHTDATLSELETWTTHKHYHVRRLVSEGTRPLLPWSGRLSIAIDRPLPMLNELHSDSTRYVTRSVANHLNDIAKHKPAIVLATLKRWKQEGRQEADELQWMSNHALRTLVKQGHPGTLRFLGFRPNPKIKVTRFELATSTVRPGESIEFSTDIEAEKDERLVVDYVIDFVKANGELAPKVHKLKQLEINKGQTATLNKKHKLHANATTYTLYPGTHRVTLQINGKPFGTRDFELKK